MQETFAKCRRKVSVDFPSEARGWICLTSSDLSPDQRAIVTAKTQGELKFEVVAPAMRSCFPEFKANRRGRAAPALLVQQSEADEEVELPPTAVSDDGPDVVAFDEVEAFLAERGMNEPNATNETYEEDEIAEVLAATWRERRSEMSKLQKSRRFGQVNAVSKQFSREVTELQKKSRCRQCEQIGHWARNCAQRSSGASSSKQEREKAHGAVMVEEAYLVSSPGYGIIDSGCSRTLIGQETLNQFLRLFHEQNMSTPTTRSQQNLFRFGNGQEERIDACVHSRPARSH